MRGTLSMLVGVDVFRRAWTEGISGAGFGLYCVKLSVDGEHS